MKTTDLMIGDWVHVYTKGNDRGVFTVDDELLHGMMYPNLFDIKPIPLTPEILEKNGFEISSEHARYYFEEEGEKYEFVLRKMYYINNPKVQKGWAFYAFNVLTLVDYVHELQHALKLCGIKKEIVL